MCIAKHGESEKLLQSVRRWKAMQNVFHKNIQFLTVHNQEKLKTTTKVMK